MTSHIELAVQKPGSPAELISNAQRLALARIKKPPELASENKSTTLFAKGLPDLYGDKRVRVDPLSGAIYVRSWRRKPDKQKVEANQSQLAIHVPTISVETWTKRPDIENAIRGSRHIIEKNSPGGQSIEGLNVLMDLSEDLFEQFRSGEITPENLTDYLAYAYEVIKDSHLLKAHIPNKQEAILQIRDALHLDSLGRFNPLIARTKLAASVIKLIEEKLIAGQTVEKYNYLLVSILMAERNAERFYLQHIISLTQEFLNMPPNHKEIIKAANQLKSASRTFLNPELILVAPYRQAAILFDSFVFGWEEKNIKGQKKLISSMYSNDLVEQINSIHQTPKDGSPESLTFLKGRLKIGIESLQKTLELGESNLESV